MPYESTAVHSQRSGSWGGGFDGPPCVGRARVQPCDTRPASVSSPTCRFRASFEIYAEHGFRAFEYNGLPRHSLQEAEQFRKKMDELRMDMGVFVVNSGGWKGDALVDEAFHAGFIKDVHRAVEYHKVMRNGWSTVTSGLAVKNLSHAQQTKNVIEGLKRAADIISKTDLVLVLEPLNVLVNHAGYFVVTSEHAAEVIDGVNSPQVKILFDIYHQQISEGKPDQQHREAVGPDCLLSGRRRPRTQRARDGRDQLPERVQGNPRQGLQGPTGHGARAIAARYGGTEEVLPGEYAKADQWVAA